VSIPSDLYVVLEVVRTASENDIKKAFRKLARRYHPDINPGDRMAEDHFKLISEAYEVLSDPLKRQFYDQNGFYSEGVLEQQTTRAGSPTWGFSFKSFEFSGSPQAPVGEAFSQFFSRQAARRDPERGQDLEYQMSIAFSDSIAGVKMRISVQRRHNCQECQGMGRASAKRSNVCATCGGNGTVTRLRGRLQFMACSSWRRVTTVRVPAGSLPIVLIAAEKAASSGPTSWRSRFPPVSVRAREFDFPAAAMRVVTAAPAAIFTSLPTSRRILSLYGLETTCSVSCL
jgi:DnaJ-class molecular chaperone